MVDDNERFRIPDDLLKQYEGRVRLLVRTIGLATKELVGIAEEISVDTEDLVLRIGVDDVDITIKRKDTDV